MPVVTLRAALSVTSCRASALAVIRTISSELLEVEELLESDEALAEELVDRRRLLSP